MMQEILMYGAVGAAAVFLGWKWFWPRKPKKPGCGPDCGCG